jgi:dethiobiotin synthase
MQRWFITGTDTEVGKTVITACLAEAAHDRGSVLALKPVASGVPVGQAGEDASSLGTAGHHPPQIFATYTPPISPHRAAIIADKPLNLQAMMSWINERTADTVLVEGVGGWKVPLRTGDNAFGIPELAEAIAAPVIVVAANRLGVLNHTLLTVESIQKAGLTVAAVILNSSDEHKDASSNTNFDDLRLLLNVPALNIPCIQPQQRDDRLQWGRVIWKSLLQS